MSHEIKIIESNELFDIQAECQKIQTLVQELQQAEQAPDVFRADINQRLQNVLHAFGEYLVTHYAPKQNTP